MKKKSGLVSLIFYPVEVLGPGKRLGIWLQGCSRRCPNCVSPHSWEFDEALRVPLVDIEQKLKFYSLFTEKLTISGGEPFEQPDFLRNLLISARNNGYKDIFVYSGQLYGDLSNRFPDIIDLIDVIIDGPYIQERKTRLIWRGSDNQILNICSKNPQLAEFYRDFLVKEEDDTEMQIVQVGKKAFVVGIPRDGKTLGQL